MKTFTQHLTEAKLVDIYHADDFNTTKIELSKMKQQNSGLLEGVGIYFASELATSKSYGKNAVVATVDSNRFIASRSPLKNSIKSSDMEKILIKLNDIDNEEFWYFLSDYIEMGEEQKVLSEKVLAYGSRTMLSLDARDFQNIIADAFSVDILADIWVNILKSHGTYSKINGYYTVIDTSVKLKKVK